MAVTLSPSMAGAVGYGAEGIAQAAQLNAEARDRGARLDLDRQRLRQQDEQHGDQFALEAAKFQASQNPSNRDTWEAGQKVQSALAINQGQLSQAENMRLQRLQSSMSGIDEALGQNQITPEQAQEMRFQAQGLMTPLQARHAQTQVQMQQQQLAHQTEQNRVQQSMRIQNAQAAAGNIPQQTLYDQSILGELTNQHMANNDMADTPQNRQTATQAAQALMTQQRRGVRQVIVRQRSNGEVEYDDAIPGGRGSSSGANGGAAGTGGGAGGGRDLTTIHQLHQEFNRRWDSDLKPADFDKNFTTPEAREEERRKIRSRWTKNELADVDSHIHRNDNNSPDNPSQNILRDEIEGHFQNARAAQPQFPQAAAEIGELTRRLQRMTSANHGVPATGPARDRYERDLARVRALSQAINPRRTVARTTERTAASGGDSPQTPTLRENFNELGGDTRAAGRIARNVGSNAMRAPEALGAMAGNAWENATGAASNAAAGLAGAFQSAGGAAASFWQGLTGK